MNLVIEQLLHGYDHGHRRIAGSVDLPAEGERLVLELSDISGSEMEPSFDGYLTGYRVRGTKYFALAKTWYAHEMPRSGSVWTHTLLVSISDLAFLDSPSDLVRLFTRPSLGLELSNYSEALVLGDDSTEINHQELQSDLILSDMQRWLSLKTLEGLYANPKSAIRVVADDARLTEPMVLMVWCQQWPRLRRSFRFCTGSLEDRNGGPITFDLQVLPRTSRTADKGNFVDASWDPDTYSRTPEWLATACVDLGLQGQTPLRQFLRHYAAEAVHPRRVFRPLTQAFLALRGSKGQKRLSHLIGAVAEAYPESDRGIRLKADVMTTLLNSSGYEIARQEALRALIEGGRAFDFTEDVLEGVVRRIQLVEPQVVVEILRQLPMPPKDKLQNSIANVLIQDLDTSVLVQETVSRPAALEWFAQTRPEIATREEIWTAFPTRHRYLMHLLQTSHLLSEHLIPWLLENVLQSTSDMDVEHLYEALGLPVAVDFLQWLDSQPEKARIVEKADNFTKYLTARPREFFAALLANESVGIRSARIAVRSLDPSRPSSLSVRSPDWLNVADSLLDAVRSRDLSERAEVVAFVAIAALQSRPSEAAQLMERVLSDLHAALEKSAIDDESWRLLERLLPPPPRYRSWDRCFQLRALVLNRVSDGVWPARLLASESEEMLRLTLAEAGDRKDAKSIAKRLAVGLNGERGSPGQKRLLQSYIKSHTRKKSLFW